MCVVGYDDSKFGGAFEIMNSWGTDWGDKGFIWIRYNDFAKHVRNAVEMHVAAKPKPAPLPPPAPKPTPVQPPVPEPEEKIRFSGELKFQLTTGGEMPVTQLNRSGIPTYKTQKPYIGGTRYRIYLSNNEPAFVYIIGSDLTNAVSKVFPYDKRVSPALYYKSNNIAIPDEQHAIEMDRTNGTDFVLFLYSLKELPIDDLVNKIRTNRGDFAQKVKGALGGDLVPFEEVVLERQGIKFSSKSQKSVVAVVVEVDHVASGY
jgi:hypothetical protein